MLRFSVFMFLSLVLGQQLLFASNVKQSYKMKPIANTLAFTLKLKQKQLVIGEKSWNAEEYCSAATIDRPELLEAFSVKHNKYKYVIYCPGLREGDLNTLSAFGDGVSPNAVVIDPGSESNSLTKEEFETALRDLLS